MYTVYWTVCQLRHSREQHDAWKSMTGEELSLTDMELVHHGQEITSLTEALNYCEALRAKRRSGEAISAITMVSENPNSVGQAGVDVTGPEYNWKKRREQ